MITRRSLYFDLIASGVSVALALTAEGTTEERLNRTFKVAPGGSLTVEVDFGNLEVTGDVGSEVTVEVYRKVRGRSDQAEKDFLAERPVTFDQQGNHVTLRAVSPVKLSWNRKLGMKETAGQYVIRVPSRYQVKLDTSGGHLQVTDLEGATKAETGGGGLRFTRVNGPIHGRTSGGGIQLTECRGDLKIDTSGGGIVVTGGGGNLTAATSGGNIAVKQFAGSAKVETSGGGLTLENIGGDLSGNTSGGPIHAVLPHPLPGPVKLETSGGGVTVRVVPEAAFQLDAKTSAGRCTSEITLAKQTSNRKVHEVLQGVFGDGGPNVCLRSSGGSIWIKATETLH